MKQLFSLILLCLSLNISGQFVTHGPFVGGLTADQARIYVRANEAATFTLQYSETVDFTSIQEVVFECYPSNDFTSIISLTGLIANTTYYYRIRTDQAQIVADDLSFTTFPLPGTDGQYSFTFSSCDKFVDVDSLYQTIDQHEFGVFINLGDWAYPDVTDNLPDYPDFFSCDYDRVEASYRTRYGSTYFQEFARHNAIDYIYDDHDFVNNNASQSSVSYDDFSSGSPVFQDIPFDPECRSNSINGYVNLFPSYTLEDTDEGLYHNFTYGNIEFFFLDNRSSRSPNLEGLIQVNGDWTYDPPAGHTILGEEQMDWLLDGLENSSAEWKVLCSGTVFNQRYELYLDSLLNLANSGSPLSNIALEASLAIVDSWIGFPEDQETLFNFLEDNCIGNVIGISGDSHTGAIDDGVWAGFPELMAACLSQDNSNLAGIMNASGFPAWSEGGQGVNNTNGENVFGKVTAFSDDSLSMELIDINNEVITSYTLLGCDQMLVATSSEPLNCFDDSDGRIDVVVENAREPILYSIDDGITWQSDTFFENLSAGTYTVTVKDAKNCRKDVSVEIESPDELMLEFEITSLFEPADPIELTVEILSGGTPPYNLLLIDDYEFYNGPIVSGQEIPGLQPITYSVILEDDNGCLLDYNLFLDSFVGVDEISEGFNWVLENGSLIIQSEQPFGLELWNLQGQLTYTNEDLSDGTHKISFNEEGLLIALVKFNYGKQYSFKFKN